VAPSRNEIAVHSNFNPRLVVARLIFVFGCHWHRCVARPADHHGNRCRKCVCFTCLCTAPISWRRKQSAFNNIAGMQILRAIFPLGSQRSVSLSPDHYETFPPVKWAQLDCEMWIVCLHGLRILRSSAIDLRLFVVGDSCAQSSITGVDKAKSRVSIFDSDLCKTAKEPRVRPRSPL
jgi:hypothetical protein